MPNSNLTVGLLSATAIIFIWSGFIVFARAGVITSLTAYDITALRFMVAGSITLPFAWAWWPRHLSLGKQALVSLTGPGAIYSMLMFQGLGEASAAYGGVFANGSLPIFTALLVLAVSGIAPGRGQIFAILLIVAGGVLLAARGMMLTDHDVVIGIALFLSSSALLSIYIFNLGHLQLEPRHALALVNIPNALIFIPVWYFFLPSGVSEASTPTIVFQALYQGLGPGFLAVILFALAARHLGATMTAGFSAVVPATAAMLAVPVLGEMPTVIEWLGIATVCIGLGLLVATRR